MYRDKMERQLTLFSAEELNELVHPIKRAICKTDMLHPKKDTSIKDPYDRLVCPICEKTYTRKNRSLHNRTQIHLAYVKMNKKWKRVLFGI
jgi:hypothetical protein